MKIPRTLLVVVGLVAVGVGLSTAAITLAHAPRAAAAMTSTSTVTALPTAARPAADAALAAATAARDTRRANEILGELKKQYRYLDDVTVQIGTTPKGEEAVAYYTEGQIIVSRVHTVSLEAILAHEVWHVIDWRDNGKLDWAESLPPSRTSSYVKGGS